MRPSLQHKRQEALHDMAADHTRQGSPSVTLITAHMFSIILCILQETSPRGRGRAPRLCTAGKGTTAGRFAMRPIHGRRVAMGLRSFPRDTTAGTRHVPHDQHDGAEAVGGVEGRCTRVGARKGENG